MCEWTDKYPEGSEHWLFGEVIGTDPGDKKPLNFLETGWVTEDFLEALEPETVLKNLIENVGTDVVLSALEEHLGVPKNKPSVHWKTLKAGDIVEIEDNVHRDDAAYFKNTTGPYYVKGIEDEDYNGTMVVLLESSCGAMYWPELASLKGVRGAS